MKKMADCRVLISGINGVGLEVAKCSILGGLKSVTLHDVRDVTNKDLSSVYYASRSDIGHNRAKVVHSKLAELNSYVEVNVLEKELSREILKSFDIVVLCGEDLREVKPQVADCEALGLKYVLALSHGVFGCLFNNFGKGFYVHDQDGNEPIQSYIETLYADADAKMITVTTMEDKPHQLANNSLVRFEEIAGLPELNDQSKSFEITYISPHSFSFHYDNITATESHTGHGIVIEIKGGTTIDFKPMNLCFNDEDIMISDFGKISHPKQIVSLYALTADPQFSAQSNQQSSTDVARQCESFMQSEFSAEVEIDEKLAKSFVSQHNKGQLAPLAAIIGSLTASEVMKAATGKFTPIDQWFAFDAVECIHPELDQESQIDNEQTPSLEKQILGQKTGEYLENARLFMVGAGAIGCELIKLFALMNVATKQSSFLKVTDMDTIEKSNLNRQFLFRPRDVGSFKSEVACLAAKQINPSFNILPLTDQ
ncbi:MAG: E1 ubiquitin-activating protein, partial [Marteilia pararefringens]